MRNILLASTALVAVAGVTAASAEVSLSGNSAFVYNTWSDAGTNSALTGKNDTTYGSDSDLGASWSTTTDNGLTVSVSWDIDANDSTGSISSPSFGTVAWADAGDSEGAMGAGDGDAVEDAFYGDNTPTYDGRNTLGGGSIAYVSPAISGFQFAVGMTDGGSTSAANETSYSVTYAANVNGAAVSLGYASASTGFDNSTAGSTGPGVNSDASSINASVTMGSLTVNAAQNTTDIRNNTDSATTNALAGRFQDTKSNNLSLSYALTDAITVAAQSISASGSISDSALITDYSFDETAYGLNYKVASGVMLYATYTDFQEQNTTSNDFDGTATVIKLTVSF